MRKIICATVAMLFALAANAVGVGDMFGAFAGRFDNTYGAGHDAQAKQLDDVLLQFSQYMNKNMPESIDADTRLDRVSAEPGLHFSYHYTLLTGKRGDIDQVTFVNTLRDELKNKVCASAQVRSFLNHGVTVAYLYRTPDGAPIAGTDFQPNYCDNIAAVPDKS
jgi:hypothetical protein